MLDAPISSLIPKWNSLFPHVDYTQARKELAAIANIEEVGQTFDFYFPYYNPVDLFDKLNIGDLIVPVDDDDWIPLTLCEDIKESVSRGLKYGSKDLVAWTTLVCNVVTKEIRTAFPANNCYRSQSYGVKWPCPREYLLQHDKVKGKYVKIPLSSYPVNFKSITSLSNLRYYEIDLSKLVLEVPCQLPLCFYEKWAAWIDFCGRYAIK